MSDCVAAGLLAIGQSQPTTARKFLIAGSEFSGWPPRCLGAEGEGPSLARRREGLGKLIAACVSLWGHFQGHGARLVTVVLGRRLIDNGQMLK